VLIASEVSPVLKALREHGIEVTATHNHMLDDEPRFYFMQYREELSVFAQALLLAASLMWAAPVAAQTTGAPLIFETKIPLGDVSGRIDHLGIDLKRQRLLVAELGNDSLGVVDLAAGKVLRTISGLSEPQGVAYAPLPTASMWRMAVTAQCGCCAAMILR